jgi:GMP synthase (glutamine-hydrolysing)
MTIRILIVDSAPGVSQSELVAHGGSPHGENYANALRSQLPAELDGFEYFVLAAGDGEKLPPGLSLGDFSGVVWTGSPLSAYEDQPIVRHQIEFARTAYESGIPCFGSCWGLQVMVVALGGLVHRHREGLEFGIARHITLTPAGRAHPMYEGKRTVFDALSVHQDEVCALPPGARHLAGNDHTAIQSVEISDDGRLFWGVQYHPEYNLQQMAALLSRATVGLVKSGFARTTGDIESMAADFRALHKNPGSRHVIWRYGLTAEIIDPLRHGLELANWLRLVVLPRAAAHRR